MKKSMTDPVVIARDPQEIARRSGYAQELAEATNKLSEAAQKLGIDLTLEEIDQLSRANSSLQADAFAREKKAGNAPVKMGGMVWAADKVAQMLDIDTTRFTQLVAHLKGKRKNISHWTNGGVNLSCLELLADGSVQVSEQALQGIRNTYSTCFSTERELAAYAKAQQIHALLDAFTQEYNMRLILDPSNRTNPVLKQVHEAGRLHTLLDVHLLKNALSHA
jgi:hypothetical protein